MNDRIASVLETKGRQVATVAADVPVFMAVLEMNERRIGSLLVVEEDRVIGILTERDILTRIVARVRDPITTLVGEVMTDQVITVSPETTIAEALIVVTDRRCRHLPVLDHGRLCGLVSAGDLTSWLVREQERTIVDLYGYITR
jgi:CBS domain-containing protein